MTAKKRELDEAWECADEWKKKCEKAEARVKVLENGIRKYRKYRRSMQAGYDTGEQDEMLYSMLSKEATS